MYPHIFSKNMGSILENASSNIKRSGLCTTESISATRCRSPDESTFIFRRDCTSKSNCDNNSFLSAFPIRTLCSDDINVNISDTFNCGNNGILS